MRPTDSQKASIALGNLLLFLSYILFSQGTVIIRKMQVCPRQSKYVNRPIATTGFSPLIPGKPCFMCYSQN